MITLSVFIIIIIIYLAAYGLHLLYEDIVYWNRIKKDLEYKIDMLNRSNNSKE